MAVDQSMPREMYMRWTAEFHEVAPQYSGRLSAVPVGTGHREAALHLEPASRSAYVL